MRMFGSKRDEVTGGWRKLHNEELHNLYSSPSIIRMIQVKEDQMGRVCSTHGQKRNAYRILVGKPEGREDNIKMDLSEIGWGSMDLIHLRIGASLRLL
jgi:hypothetical protein